ncbi:uncharacterized protein PFL1_06281 [Pseudozyma flocculosa PF-1]|nr:uncharacterized protein PFL1_06281 [Pseudozyma flocculosa PF-1]EPQ26073.1 hypothetical protein PFL1_06281 [Pseudozyma flocculosa PF-1]
MSTAAPVGHPPHFAPPILEVIQSSQGGHGDDVGDGNGDDNQTTAAAAAASAAKRRKADDGSAATPDDGAAASHFISQTPAILAFLAPRLGLLGDLDGLSDLERDIRRAQIHQLTLTALDVSNEAHETHHPVAVDLYYEDQKQEAKRRSDKFRNLRVPKFLKCFQLTLDANRSQGQGQPRLVGDKTTVADLTLFQVVDGLKFAFPRLMASLESGGEYALVFGLHAAVAKELEGYLQSERRRPYSSGVFRHYPELDGEVEA